MNKTIRIRTAPGGDDSYVKVKLDQEFDFIEILSLKITQEDVYRKFCADYGVVAGRVIANNGIGVPNAKISVFIPITDVDSENPAITSIYPYKTIVDRDDNGVRYNLLPDEVQGECHTPVGTMSSKRGVLDNDLMAEVYEKYYKYTTITNDAGDYLIFGVPVGQHIIHMDVDLSDIGYLSQRPYDMIRIGMGEKLFNSPTQFKGGDDLNSLAQIKTQDMGVNVQPFWGDSEFCEVGISRVDFNISYRFEPSALFIGSVFSDSDKHSVSKTCRPRKKLGKICETTTGEGSVEMIRKTLDGSIETFNVSGGRVIDSDGTWAYQIPMNLDYKITDEYGNLTNSQDPDKGIPTSAKVRFKVSLDQDGGEGRIRTRGKYLVPNNPLKTKQIDYEFGKLTKDSSLFEMKWGNIYTVRNFITRYQLNKIVNNRNFVGIKNVDDCGSHTPFPYNRVDTDVNPLYSVLCLIITILVEIIGTVNNLLIPAINFVVKTINQYVIPPINATFNLICQTIETISSGLCEFLDLLQEKVSIDITLPVIDYRLKISAPGCPSFLKNMCVYKGVDGECCGDIIGEVPYVPCIGLMCSGDMYAPNCSGEGLTKLNETNTVNGGSSDKTDYLTCISITLGDVLNVFEFDFYNDWVNGCLYMPLLKYKKKRNDKTEKYCNYDCGEDFSSDNYNQCRNSYIVDSGFGEDNTSSNANNWTGNRLVREGIAVKYDGDIYYAASTHNISNPLYMTDMYSLGGMLECSGNKDPVIHEDIVSTTYQMPDFISDSDRDNNEDEVSIDKVLFSEVDCLGFKIGSQQRNNINTICEIGVDLTPEDETNADVIKIGNDFINNEVLRQRLIKLNTSTSKSYSTITTDFYSGENYYKTMNINNDYSDYRGVRYDGINFAVSGNSFYFYFGIIPGKSALDKARGRFLTKCDVIDKEPFIIGGKITNVTTDNGSDGSITLTIDGVELNDTTKDSYTIRWSDTNLGTGYKLTNLSSGIYQVTITKNDVNRRTSSATFSVNDPPPISYVKYVYGTKTSTSLDGIILIDNLSNGTAPYTLNLTKDGVDVSTEVADIDTATFSGLSKGTYSIAISDSSDKSITVDNIIVSGPSNMIVTKTTTDTKCYNKPSGIVSYNISGGVKPYTVKTFYGDIEKTGLKVTGLSAGTFDFVVTDANGGTYTPLNADKVLINGPKTPFTCTGSVTNNIVCYNASKGKFTINGSGGVKPYSYSLNSGDWIEFTDKTSTSETIEVENKGTYKVKLLDGNECISNTASIFVDGPLSPIELNWQCVVENNNIGLRVMSVRGGGGSGKIELVTPNTYDTNTPFIWTVNIGEKILNGATKSTTSGSQSSTVIITSGSYIRYKDRLGCATVSGAAVYWVKDVIYTETANYTATW